jgi:hypothetical protein
MGSEVKSAHCGILKILLSYLEAFLVRNLSSFPFGVRRFFLLRGCGPQAAPNS